MASYSSYNKVTSFNIFRGIPNGLNPCIRGGLRQEQAAEQMNVSRPTLTRIYEQARKTIAQALVEGNMVNIEGGNVQFDREWFRCRRCYKLVGGRENHVRCKDCKTYGNDELMPINAEGK